jgi:DNA-binding CsgD family transcriptional regulator/methanogenic corrinoid protein MtbC1
MSTSAAYAEDQLHTAPTSHRMLVCAPDPVRGEANVSLADGFYDTADERVFWRESPERAVLRLPHDRPVAVRRLRDFAERPTAAAAAGTAPGVRALLRAVEDSRSRADEGQPSLLGTALADALLAGDADLAFAQAVLLWKQCGLVQTYDEMSQCLSGLASSWAAGTGSVLAEHRASRVVSQVTDRLATLTPAPVRHGNVVLAVPAGDQHTVALSALAHLVQDAGWPTQVVAELPLTELVDLAAAPDTAAVVISIHTAVPADAVRRLVAALREAAPGVLIALGGPGLPRHRGSMFGADLLGTDVEALLQRLDNGTTALTEREIQVLTAVADGLTNVEISHRLGVAPATVKSHLDHILTKTGTEHRAGAVAVALRRGWIT